MNTDLMDTTCAAYFAEDLLEYALSYHCIIWKAPRPLHRKEHYTNIPGDCLFNENIGRELLKVHSKNDSFVKKQSTLMWRKISEKQSVELVPSKFIEDIFTNFINTTYKTHGYSLETLLLIIAIVVSSCIPCCHNGSFKVLKEICWSIRYALLTYSARTRDTIKKLQALTSKRTV